MKIVIDVDKLLREGRITDLEYARLKEMAVEETGSLAFNVLVGFGVIATAAGAAALLPTAPTAVAVGFALAVVGAFVSAKFHKHWGLLGSILLVVGSVVASGGIIAFTNGSVESFLAVTALCLIGAVIVKSNLLAALSVLALSATVGAMTAYDHATYELIISQPALTVGLFTALSIGAYLLSKYVPPDHERIAITFARTSVFMANFGFWVGSLWGDDLGRGMDRWNFRSAVAIPDWVFAIGWAVALVITGVWAARRNRRWVVNVVAVFGAIHFYTQYFERLGASPASILISGLLALGIVFAMVYYNRAFKSSGGSAVAVS